MWKTNVVDIQDRGGHLKSMVQRKVEWELQPELGHEGQTASRLEEETAGILESHLACLSESLHTVPFRMQVNKLYVFAAIFIMNKMIVEKIPIELQLNVSQG